MRHLDYLLIGGGIAADAAARGIRDRDPRGTIGLIGEEPHPPYDRPPLSKELWKGGSPDDLWRGTADLGVEFILGRRAVSLDLAERRVADDAGDTYSFGKLLLATGGKPRRLAGDQGDVVYFRTLDDFHRLRRLAQDGGRFAVLGGGLIGPEIAAALRGLQRDVVMLFPEPAIASRILPRELAHHLTDTFRSRGVEVRADTTVTAVRARDGHQQVTTRTGRTLHADVVVAGLGIVPETRLARAAGLPVADGILVDDRLRAGHPDVYAAGDVACFPSHLLGRGVRVEHEDAANAMGWHAGQNMAGADLPFRHVPSFYSDLFDLHLEGIGEVDPATTDTLVDWVEPLRRGTVFHLRDGQLRGVLLWNLPGRIRRARRLLEEPGAVEPESLRGRLSGGK
jgi:3-phenylpropionate/trans-cinnamate dioxygenase ferredoxin reductase component